MLKIWALFWRWYERTYTLNISIALFLFLLQIVHLIWLFSDVVWGRLFGVPLFDLQGWYQILIIFVDYTEIPALISVSLIYINELRGQWSFKSILYLAFLNIQWVHLFWITDEFVADALIGQILVALPAWLAWVAILIDFLEVPVMIDVLRTFIHSTLEGRAVEFLKTEFREE
ncbi:hypothetical protein HY970_03655 [Candidatus Kaiserbacteria bacterium]|nr:hypothetical protein [Candidatus Kaiserbacteria bacterium]